jgi:hypothetical protein
VTVTAEVLTVAEELEVEAGVAGHSARAMAQAKRERQLAFRAARLEQRPLIGRIQNLLDGPATAGDEWFKGAVGEEKLGAALDALRSQGVFALHDRSIPKSKANIDHIAIGPNGIWVIDAKRYSGKVQVVNKGGWFREDIRLYVGGRDRSKLVPGVHRQREHVRAALAGTGFEEMPISGALCFVDTEWPLFTRPKIVGGVVVSWGRALWKLVLEPGDFDEAQRAAIHRHLAQALPAK